MENKGFSKILILIIIIVILIFGVGFLAWQMGWIFKTKTSIPQTTQTSTPAWMSSFNNKFNEIYNLQIEVGNEYSGVADLDSNIKAAVDKAKNKDYSGALNIINQNLNTNTDLISKVNLLDNKVDELKAITDNIPDQTAKAATSRIVDLAKSRDKSFLQILSITEKRLNLYKKSYTDALALGKPSLISQTQENALIKEFTNESKNFIQISNNLRTAETEPINY